MKANGYSLSHPASVVVKQLALMEKDLLSGFSEDEPVVFVRAEPFHLSPIFGQRTFR
jgi:hypothetical protein